MKTKEAKMKNKSHGSEMGKINAAAYYACSCSGTKHPCTYHCKKCFFEAIYCPR